MFSEQQLNKNRPKSFLGAISRAKKEAKEELIVTHFTVLISLL